MSYQVSQFERVIRQHDETNRLASDARLRERNANAKFKQCQDRFVYLSETFVPETLEAMATARANLIDAVASTDRHNDTPPAQYVIEYDDATATHAKACEQLAEAERQCFTAEKRLRKCQEATHDAEQRDATAKATLNMWRRRINNALKTPEQRLTEALTPEKGALLKAVDAEPEVA